MNALMEQTQQLVTTLYGTNLSREIARLQKLLEGRDGWGASGEIDFSFYQQQRDLAAAQAQQAEQQAKLERLTGINSLVANLGQLLNIPGQSLEGLAKQFELPLDQFASDLGISQGKLEEYIRQQAERANAILTVNDTILSTGGLTNRLLRDIRDQTTLADASESRQVTGSFSTSGNVTSIGRTDRITARQAPEIRVRVDSADTAKQVASSERNAETSKLILKVLLENLPELRLSAEESVDEFREWRKSQRDNRYNNRKQA